MLNNFFFAIPNSIENSYIVIIHVEHFIFIFRLKEICLIDNFLIFFQFRIQLNNVISGKSEAAVSCCGIKLFLRDKMDFCYWYLSVQTCRCVFLKY